MEFSWNPDTKCTKVPQSSFSTHRFSDVLSFSKICQPPGQNQQNGKQCCLPALYIEASNYLNYVYWRKKVAIN